MLYNNYTSRIKNIITKSHERKAVLQKSMAGTAIGNIYDKKFALKEQMAFAKVSQFNQQELSTIMQNVNIESATIGLHPDFQYLKGSGDIEMHYIVSIFIDIKGSTALHKEYELNEIFEITNTIQTAAIHTCLAMGGHVQRLQGDGVFAYFGGKTISKEQAVQSAMIACSMFTYFVKNDLKNIFLQDNIEDIKTRIGVDFGDDSDVMWANFGVANVSELTTLSLHTSLASKMQSEATPNGIVVGQYIKDRMKSSETYFNYVIDSKGEIKRYIFQNEKKGFRYTQYAFNWYGFLKSLPFVGCDSTGNFYLIKPGAPAIIQSPTQQKDHSALGALIGNTKPYIL
jgi:adenylate cyclase